MTGRKGRVVQTDAGIQYESRSEIDIPLETLNLTGEYNFQIQCQFLACKRTAGGRDGSVNLCEFTALTEMRQKMTGPDGFLKGCKDEAEWHRETKKRMSWCQAEFGNGAFYRAIV